MKSSTRRLAQQSSIVCMSLDSRTSSIRLKIVSGTSVNLHMRRTNLKKIKYLYDNVYLASFRRKFVKIAFLSDAVDWFDAS